MPSDTLERQERENRGQQKDPYLPVGNVHTVNPSRQKSFREVTRWMHINRVPRRRVAPWPLKSREPEVRWEAQWHTQYDTLQHLDSPCMSQPPAPPRLATCCGIVPSPRARAQISGSLTRAAAGPYAASLPSSRSCTEARLPREGEPGSSAERPAVAESSQVEVSLTSGSWDRARFEGPVQ